MKVLQRVTGDALGPSELVSILKIRFAYLSFAYATNIKHSTDTLTREGEITKLHCYCPRYPQCFYHMLQPNDILRRILLGDDDKDHLRVFTIVLENEG